MTDPRTSWWPVATTTEVHRDQPVGRVLHTVPIVVFRDREMRAAILIDRCPHRHAQLSTGKVCRGELQCPYHGWTFNSDGLVTGIPGLETKISRTAVVPPVATRETGGLIWACLAPTDSTPEPVTATEVSGELDTFFIVDSVRTTLDSAAENFLDGFHTHFVHAGWIRREGKRQRVKTEVLQMASSVEAHYRDETLQSGLISRLLEGDRTESIARFRMPGIAELEYRGRKGLNLMVTVWFTPESADRVRIHARVATRQGLVPAWSKRLLLSRLFDVVLQQDKAILERTHDNIARFARRHDSERAPAYINSQLDLLGPSIRRLLNGEILEECRKTQYVLL